MHNRTPLERLVVEPGIDENTLSVPPQIGTVLYGQVRWQQAVVLFLDHGVAFAGSLFKPATVSYRNVTTPIEIGRASCRERV